MRILPDTHLLLWAAAGDARLSSLATRLLSDPANERLFSASSIVEIAIKFARGKPDFTVHPLSIRDNLLRAGYDELPITSDHALALAHMPLQHADPFDRLLLAQAAATFSTLLTADRVLASYGGPVLFVG